MRHGHLIDSLTVTWIMGLTTFRVACTLSTTRVDEVMMFALESVGVNKADSSATLRNDNQENTQRQPQILLRDAAG